MSDLSEFLLARIDEEQVKGDGIERFDTIPDDCRDPARVLAECESKRRIVAWAEAHPKTCDEVHPQHDIYHPDGHGPNDVARLVALPYVDHPDFREEWRP